MTLAKARHGALLLATSSLPIAGWHANRKPRHKGCIIPLNDRVVPWRVGVHWIRRAALSQNNKQHAVIGNEDWARSEWILAVHNSKLSTRNCVVHRFSPLHCRRRRYARFHSSGCVVSHPPDAW